MEKKYILVNDKLERDLNTTKFYRER